MISGAVAAAIRMKRDAMTFYEASSNRARLAFGREMFKGFIFDRLPIEKNDNFSILNETCTFLENTGHWCMFEERGAREG